MSLEPLEQRRIRFDLVETFKILNGLSPLRSEDFFIESQRDTRPKLMGQHGKCNERRHFFSNRVVAVYNSLPRDITDASKLNEFKIKLDRNLESFKMSPLTKFQKNDIIAT